MTSAITSVFTSPSLGDKCCDPGNVVSYQSKGAETQMGGVSTYVVGDSSNAVIYVTDIFGYQFSNSRQLADSISEAGFTVLMPDMFHGDAISAEQAIAQGKMSLMKWLPSHSVDSTVELIERFATELIHSHKYKSIQAIGFCYGATHVARLLTTGQISAGVITHAAMLDKSYADSINKPVLFNCAELDEFFSPDDQHQFQQRLAARGIAGTFIEYPSVKHGFTTRTGGAGWNETGDKADATTAEQQKKVKANIVQFLKDHAQ